MEITLQKAEIVKPKDTVVFCLEMIKNEINMFEKNLARNTQMPVMTHEYNFF